jgi:hypothetical protein
LALRFRAWMEVMVMVGLICVPKSYKCFFKASVNSSSTASAQLSRFSLWG